MKKILLSATALFTIVLSSNAQKIIPCASNEAVEIALKNVPGYAAKLNAAQTASSNEYQAFLQNQIAAKSSTISGNYTYTVPVVFHILHLGEPIGTGSNTSDALCISALAQVNRDFARKGSDTVNIDPLYEPLYVNSGMHFELAKKDPMGNCTNGLIHHYDPKTNWDQDDLFNYKYSTMAPGNWNPTKYLNIYIVKDIIGASQGIIVGYTYKPGTAPIDAADAIVYNNSFLTGLNARSLSHEIGHWFGLSHTFGGSNEAGKVCGNDDIADTPKTAGFFSTCPLPYTSLNDSCDVGKRPNMNNIMDYSGCPMMFTQGQTDKMRLSASSPIAGRDSLTGDLNLYHAGFFNNVTLNTYTVVNTNTLVVPNTTFATVYSEYIASNPTSATPCAPEADFSSNKKMTCTGGVVNFYSTSYNGAATNYTWTFQGGNPSTSNLATETVTYSTPGVYDVTLVASNADGSTTKSVSSYIVTNWNSSAITLPYNEDFESAGWDAWSKGWSISNSDAFTPYWQLSNYGSGTSAKSMILPNANSQSFVPGYTNIIDVLETPTFDFSNTSTIGFSFDYSFARKTGVVQDTFKVQYSLDCGGTWKSFLGVPSTATIASTTGGTVNAPYIPWSSTVPNPKWKTWTALAINTGTMAGLRDVKFRFWFKNDYVGAQSQNLYIDNVNISGVVGLNEFENSLGLSIYPNPTSASSDVEFTSPNSSKVNISVYDVAGRLVEQNEINALSGVKTKVAVNASSNLNSGIYFITLVVDNNKVTKKLIIQ